MNVLQRGVFGEGKSQWKLQADYGKPSCRWSDGATAVKVPAPGTDKPPAMKVGAWYGLRCERTQDGAFVLTMTGAGGEVVYTSSATARLGPIVPDAPVLIGANSASGESQELSDQLHGDVKDVFVSTTG